MKVLHRVLPEVLASFQPEMVMYNAGTDVHKDDSLGKMSLTNDGIFQRDRFVMKSCAEAGIAVAAAIGGGYEVDHERIVDRHVLLHRAAAEYVDLFYENVTLRRKREQQTVK